MTVIKSSTGESESPGGCRGGGGAGEVLDEQQQYRLQLTYGLSPALHLRPLGD